VRNQFVIVLIFLGISAASWVFGKMKEKAEAQEAQERARIHRERVDRLSDQGQQPKATPRPQQSQAKQLAQQQAMQRKQQLALLRQERLAALRAEMAARLQSPSQSQSARPTATPRPARAQAPSKPRPTAQPQPQPTRTNVATMRKPPSVSHDRSQLADLKTHARHAEHTSQDEGESTVHRLVTDAEITVVHQTRHGVGILTNLTTEDWRRAIIMSELLAPPVSMRGGI